MMSNYQKLVDTVRSKGAKAYRDGLALDNCPYVTLGKQGNKFRRLWCDGYLNERDRFEDNVRAINNGATCVIIVVVDGVDHD